MRAVGETGRHIVHVTPSGRRGGSACPFSYERAKIRPHTEEELVSGAAVGGCLLCVR